MAHRNDQDVVNIEVRDVTPAALLPPPPAVRVRRVVGRRGIGVAALGLGMLCAVATLGLRDRPGTLDPAARPSSPPAPTSGPASEPTWTWRVTVVCPLHGPCPSGAWIPMSAGVPAGPPTP